MTDNDRWQLAVRAAGVAAVFALVVCAALLWNYSRRVAKEPLESPPFQKLKAELAQTTKDETLDPRERERKLARVKEQIRAMDLQVRARYFRQRHLAATGAWLLLGAAALVLLSGRMAATLRRKLPAPALAEAPREAESAQARPARWAVAALAALLAAAGVWSGIAFVPTVPWPGTAQPDKAAPTVQAEAAPAAAGDFASEEEMMANWPRFRGHGGTGITREKGIPITWDAKSGKNILWKTPVPLPGHGSPVVWGDRVFLSGASERSRQVLCFDAANGKLLWSKELPGTPQSTGAPPKVSEDTGFAASTTATDGRRVFAIFANGDVGAMDFEGKLAWARSLGVPKNDYGHASSLLTYRNLLLVQFDQGTGKDGLAKVMGLDAASGKTVWETVRKVPASWSTPIVFGHAGTDQLITAADPWVIAYDPANGTEIWRAECLKQDIGPSPTFLGDVVYAVNNFPKLSAIRADGRGDVTKSHTLWVGEDGLPDTCSPLAAEGRVYLLASSGTLTCYDAKSGQKAWEKDFDTEFYASPSFVEGRVYLIGKEGKCWVVEPGDKDGKEVGHGEMGENCVTSPAFRKGRMYLRGAANLFCIGAR